MKNLKPCPFCGGKAEIIESWLISGSYTPSCTGCDICPGQNVEQDEQGGFAADYDSPEEAIEAWNTRADDLRLQSLLEAVNEVSLMAYGYDHLYETTFHRDVHEALSAALTAFKETGE